MSTHTTCSGVADPLTARESSDDTSGRVTQGWPSIRRARRRPSQGRCEDQARASLGPKLLLGRNPMSPYVWVIPCIGTADMVGGEVGKVRPIWWRAIGSAVIPIGVFLAACSHDPVQPARVQLMGAGSVPDVPVPTMGGPQPVVSSAGIRRIVAAPAPTPSAAPPRHDLKRASVAGDHPTSTRKNARGRLAIRHVAAPSRHAKPYSGTRQSTAQGAGAEVIPLDNPAGSTRAQPWVSPPPAEPPQAGLRSPGP